MRRFWQSVVEPALLAIAAKRIIEVGSDRGANTRLLLDYCRRHRAFLEVIDPAPGYDPAQWQREYEGSVRFHLSLSLNVLSRLEPAAAVLLDGDHNWYTVFHELKLLAKAARRAAAPFPLVILHDIAWPYARRDLYYDPETIPPAFRKPYRQQGLLPEIPEPVAEGGLNPHLHNAIYENDLQNGVLTAVEDFIAQADEELRLLQLPGLHGLGLLYRPALAAGSPLGELISRLEPSPPLAAHLAVMERQRLETVLLAEERARRLSGLESRLREAAERSKALSRRVEELEGALAGERGDSTALRARLTAEREQAAIQTRRLAELEQELTAEREQAAIQTRRLAELEQELTAEREQAATLTRRLAELQARQNEMQREAARALTEIGKRDQLLERYRGLNVTLIQDLERVRNSTSWRLGHGLIRLARRALRRSPSPATLDHLVGVLHKAGRWTLPASPPAKKAGPAAPSGKNRPVEAPGGVKTVDIVVPVHNALEDSAVCLETLKETRDGFPGRVLVINDGSGPETTAWLRDYQRREPWFELLEHPANLGYTKTVNHGLAEATASSVVLLNSDTVVTPGWLTGMVGCLNSDPAIGIVGPLSNAASWQNVPELLDREGGFAVNELPTDLTPAAMAELVAAISRRCYPRLPFINGFCFLISRPVLAAVGLMDEENFPEGYGEENDYCLRAAAAGFELAVADDAYVFHAKSRSFGHRRRRELSRRGSRTLRRKHGAELVAVRIEQARSGSGELERIRAAVAEALAARPPLEGPAGLAPMRVLFLLPVRGGGGGAHSVVQEVTAMHHLGVHAKIAVRANHRPDFLELYRDIPAISRLILGFTEQDLPALAADYDIVVGTIFSSLTLLRDLLAAHPRILPAYYVQDYEPLFFPPESEKWQEACRSYTLIPNTLLFAKTAWIAEQVRNQHGVAVHKVEPSLDHRVYRPRPRTRDKLIHIAAMIRPQTPRRGAARTMRVLARLSGAHPQRLCCHLFGCADDDPRFLELERGFPFRNHGVLTRPEVAGLLGGCDIFIDLSDYQAFGRTALEAMACGCAAVVPARGGTDEYAVDGGNALMVDSADEEDSFARLDALVADPADLARLRRTGLLTAARYSVHRAAVSEIDLFQRALSAHRAPGHHEEKA